MSFFRLDQGKITATADRLALRIGERFPDAGLAGIAKDLTDLSRRVAIETATLAKPIWWLRVTIAVVVLAGAIVFSRVGTILPIDAVANQALHSVESFEAAVNTAILVGLGLYTLVTLEMRLKRQRVLTDLNQLRSLIHVVDMHQLTKDPATLDPDFAATEHSPKRSLTPDQLGRYLDYCSEMISIAGKLAALYGQAVNDVEVAEAVSDIENLGGNLSRKIWQKIAMLDHPGRRANKKAAPKGTA